MYCKDVDKKCDFCGLEIESTIPIMYDTTKLVWERFLRLLHEVYGSTVYKWGAMIWADIKGKVLSKRKS